MFKFNVLLKRLFDINTVVENSNVHSVTGGREGEGSDIEKEVIT